MRKRKQPKPEPPVDAESLALAMAMANRTAFQDFAWTPVTHPNRAVSCMPGPPQDEDGTGGWGRVVREWEDKDCPP